MVYCDDVEISQNDVLQSPSIVVIIEDECLSIYNNSSVYTILFVYVCVIFLYVCGCLCVVWEFTKLDNNIQSSTVCIKLLSHIYLQKIYRNGLT